MNLSVVNLSTVSLLYWWVLPAAALAAVVLLVARRIRTPRPARQQDSVPIAHGDRLTALPAYQRALRRYRALLVASVSLALLGLLASVVLVSRPVATSVTQPDLANRDIVLCLDVSGSMVDYDAELASVFADLSSQFTGERISLVLFNASAVTYFPLSSDYGYIARQLERLQQSLASDDESLYNGTLLGDGSSLIGDGLASCALRFDTPEADRSRSIILATDNVLAGRSIYTLPQAGQLASSKNIRVYGINPGDTSARDYLDSLATEYKTVVEATGGAYYALGDPTAIPGIVTSITSEQAAALPGVPVIREDDIPSWPFLALLVGLGGYFVLAWRLRR